MCQNLIQPEILLRCRNTQVERTGNVVRKHDWSCDYEKAKAFSSLLLYLQKIQDPRLVSIINVELTDDGYFYEMEYLPGIVTRAQSILVELTGEDWFEELGSKSDRILLERLQNRFPDLAHFLESSRNLYFDLVGGNVRSSQNGYQWIDLEGLEWSHDSVSGRVFLGNEVVCENYRT
jgi:hypothetical protein